ncbi:hypothetical protein ABZS53_14905 [Streptomyces sp. NPDC005499]|uniref:hypothetical protein n=1 Tax=Streptomyces sp. NPDC005499 TaxID=3154883 RepID=UPI0033A559F7
MNASSDPELCGTAEFSCFCVLPRKYCNGTHECDCGGSWSGSTANRDFTVHEFPSTYIGSSRVTAPTAEHGEPK